ncbi:hypothetical protein [Sulfurovum sp. NBC37-1]|uniref:hypothetical protein n=1 Tax=Sulfurovum sp. (strain NBC37-1) TaxID=387093 RepID=UPI0001587A71|nr:hypothetical protein [Sulfurovum sp. NBC37-1]BAF73309.1 hypothetical protein SUN_2373 [Sulfurovum sp. NBC37-1]
MLRYILIPLITLTIFTSAAEKKVSTISCEPSMVYKCTLQGCEKIKVVNIDEADIQYFEIDLAKKSLAGKIGNATVDVENIISRHGNEKNFIFFGTHADSEYDWVLRINKKSKKMVLLATNTEEDGFTVYGTCKWEEGQ